MGNKGITLIALVITVIVMLILAAVAMSAITNPEEIFSQARKAGEDYNQASKNEADEISELIDKYLEDYYFDVAVDIATTKTLPITVNITVKNNDGTNFNDKDLKYGLSISEGYTISVADGVNERTLAGGKNSEETFEVTINNTEYRMNEDINIYFNVTTPYTDTISAKIAYKKPGNPDENGIFTETSTIDGGEKGYSNPLIPAGFKPINTTDAVWGDINNPPTAENVDSGLVIEDSIENQFVWIPVDGTTLKYEKHTYETTPADDTPDALSDTGNGNWRTYYYRYYSDWKDDGANIASVARNGGFYVGRYEAGIPSNAPFYADSEGDVYYTNSTTPSKNTTTYVPVSKAKNPSWSCISQENAKVVSAKMYEESTSVTSQLIDGYAWDTIATWMNNEYPGIGTDSTNYGNHYDRNFSLTNTLYAVHSYTWETNWTLATSYSYGNVSSPTSLTNCIELATGATELTKVKNIYDMAGNLLEITTEYGYHNDVGKGDVYVVYRGGQYGWPGWRSGVGHASGNLTPPYAGDHTLGFRVVLYLSE